MAIFHPWAHMRMAFLGMELSAFTFRTAALLSPVATKMTVRAAFSTGSVRVTRCGGGFGESLMGATIFSRSWEKEAQDGEKATSL